MRKISAILIAGIITVTGAIGSVAPTQAAPRAPAVFSDNQGGAAVEQVRHRRDRHWRHGHRNRHHAGRRYHRNHGYNYGYYPRYRHYGYSPYYYRSRPGFSIQFGFGGNHW